MNIVNPYRYASAESLSDSIISYWDFDSNSNDQVGSNNGTPTTISYNSGKISNAAEFTSTSSRIVVNDSDTLTFNDGSDLPFSVSLWIKFDTIKNTNFFDKRSAAGSEYQVYYNSSTGKLYFRLFDEGLTYIYVTWEFTWSPSTATWYHFTFTYNGSVNGNGGVTPSDAGKIYLNGVLQSVTALSIIGGGNYYNTMSNTTSPFNIGYLYVTSTYTLDGMIDEFYVFNKELDATEAQFVYDEGAAGRTLI